MKKILYLLNSSIISTQLVVFSELVRILGTKFSLSSSSDTLFFNYIKCCHFYDVFIFFLRCLDARYYVVLSHFFARLNEAKFRLLQSGKLHQEVDREVSR